MIEPFICWRCQKRIRPEELIQTTRDYIMERELHEADLSCQAELCTECWREIEHSTYEECDID